MNLSFIFDVSTVVITLSAFVASQHFQVHWLLDLFLCRLLKFVVINPKTDSLKDKLQNGKPIMLINDDVADNVKSDDDLVRMIQEDVNLKVSGTAFDCGVVVAGLLKWKGDFMTNAMDNIIITKMGIEILIIKYTPRGHNRSIFIDLTRYRDKALSIHGYVSYVLTAAVAMMASNEDFRHFLVGALR